MSDADDPIRAEVERVLHALVDAVRATPARAAAALPSCVARGTQRLAEPVRLARSLLDLVGRDDPGGPVVPPPAAAPPGTPAEPAAVATGSGGPPDTPAPPEHLPIDDYESLAASQVVARLPTLTPAELRSLRDFETANRGRRTVLGRIEQLLA